MTAPKYTLHNGDSAEVLKQYPDNHFHSVVTDPPYGIEFLGKEWDSHTGTVELWKEVFRVLKPGGYLLAFSAARTYHRLATNIEDVGFDIKDQIMWIYGSGFPKAQDVGKQIQKKIDKSETLTDPEAIKWSGWKTSLKPAHEPIVMARKPTKLTYVENSRQHNCGALNIDASRLPFESDKDKHTASMGRAVEGINVGGGGDPIKNVENQPLYKQNDTGRYPSNVMGEITDYQKYFYNPKVSRAERHIGMETLPKPEDARYLANGCVLDNKAADIVYTTGDAMRELGGSYKNIKTAAGVKAVAHDADGKIMTQVTLQAMVEKRTSAATLNTLARDLGYKNEDGTPFTPGDKMFRTPEDMLLYVHGLGAHIIDRIGIAEYNKLTGGTTNHHPTVKPVDLMRYLVRLVTPPGSIVLDPFNGSGSTGMAVVAEGSEYVGIDLDPNFITIADKRIAKYIEVGYKVPTLKEQSRPGLPGHLFG